MLIEKLNLKITTKSQITNVKLELKPIGSFCVSALCALQMRLTWCVGSLKFSYNNSSIPIPIF